MPETGTTTYTYNADKTVATRVDAKGQRTEYSYDTKARLTQTRFFRWVEIIIGYSVLQEDPCQRVDYTYDANTVDPAFGAGLLGRLATRTAGISSCPGGVYMEMYKFTNDGRVYAKRLRNIRRMITSYDQDGYPVYTDKP